MKPSGHELTGLVFNIQKFSIQDGPGIRTTVFMKGCPLRCPWCSNPEGMGSAPEIMPSERKCIACKRCLEACAPGAISFPADIREIDWARCSGCLACAEVCPSRALEVVGEYRTVEETFRIAERDRDFYESSGALPIPSGLLHHGQRSGQPFMDTVVRMPGPSWIANFWMLNTSPVSSCPLAFIGSSGGGTLTGWRASAYPLTLSPAPHPAR